MYNILFMIYNKKYNDFFYSFISYFFYFLFTREVMSLLYFYSLCTNRNMILLWLFVVMNLYSLLIYQSDLFSKCFYEHRLPYLYCYRF